jgi:hypothetical protein
MISTEFPDPTAKAAETEGSQSCSKRHHWVIGNPDSISSAGKAKKKESAEVGRDQREKQHPGTQTAIGQKIRVGAVGLAPETLGTKPEQRKQVSNKSEER